MISDKDYKAIEGMLALDYPVATICDLVGVGKTKVYEVRKIRESTKPKSKVLAFGCTHFPYVREGYMDWVLDVAVKEGVTEIVHLGDLIDNHNWSRHATEPDSISGMSEFGKALDCVQDMREKFKGYKVTWTLGNHDKIPARQLYSLGLPSDVLLKPYQDLWHVPEWEVCNEKVIDGVLYKHGLGTKATLLTSLRLRQSFVSAHYHSVADVATHVSYHDRVQGMHVGSGFDDKAVAARYASESQSKSVISCGTVEDGNKFQLHFMDL